MELEELQSSDRGDLPIFVKWLDFTKWLLSTTDGFPKKARFTFAERLNDHSLKIVEHLVEARFSRSKGQLLRAANLELEKIRVLIRISYEMRFLSRKSYEFASFSINEVGRMLGGWMKSDR